MSGFHIETFFSIQDIDTRDWACLSEELPFQSHRWYTFGERVMADCSPIYVLIYDEKDPVARASLWLTRNEPLPKMAAPVRKLTSAFLTRWPLLICRSPLANASGIIVKNNFQNEAVLSSITEAALAEARKRNASILLFDYLNEREIQKWNPESIKLKMPSPGTILKNQWHSLEEFLSDGNKKDRQHYKRSLREAEKLGIHLTQHKVVHDIDAALTLIRAVEDRYSSAHNPWMRGMLENIEMMDGTWLEARIDQRLVGCGLILDDQGAQMTTALGLAEDVPYVYFLLVYASLEAAFAKQVKVLRWGTGAYEVKQRLGFEMEPNNFSVVVGTNPLTRWLARMVA